MVFKHTQLNAFFFGILAKLNRKKEKKKKNNKKELHTRNKGHNFHLMSLLEPHFARKSTLAFPSLRERHNFTSQSRFKRLIMLAMADA